MSGQATMELTVETLTDALEVAVLSPTHTIGDVESACEDAKREHLAAVCVAPYVVGRASRALRGTPIAICGAVGYPFGYADGRSKCREVGACLEAGAGEVEVPLNAPLLRSGCSGDVRAELEALRRLVQGCLLRIAVPCAHLNDTDKARAFHMLQDVGVDIINLRTSSRPLPGRDLYILKHAVRGRCAFAVDGVRTFDVASGLLEEGAKRLATDQVASLLEDFYRAEMQAAGGR